MRYENALHAEQQIFDQSCSDYQSLDGLVWQNRPKYAVYNGIDILVCSS